MPDPRSHIWFTRYWLSDRCSREKIPFVLGHVLYMKTIHGGKARNDRIDANKIATLLRGGLRSCSIGSDQPNPTQT